MSNTLVQDCIKRFEEKRGPYNGDPNYLFNLASTISGLATGEMEAAEGPAAADKRMKEFAGSMQAASDLYSLMIADTGRVQ